MNEQDIINRLMRIETLLESVNDRLQPTFTVVPQPTKPHNWPWGYPTGVGAVGTTTLTLCDSFRGAVGAAEELETATRKDSKVLKELREAYSFLRDPALALAIKEIERLQELVGE